MTRAPFMTSVDFQASYTLLFGRRRLTLSADVFNLFDSETVLNYDTWTSLAFGGPANPNFGQPTSGILAAPQIQDPRQLRVGAASHSSGHLRRPTLRKGALLCAPFLLRDGRRGRRRSLLTFDQ